MEVEINLKGETKKIQVKDILGRHQTEYVKAVAAMQKGTEEGMLGFINYRDTMVRELTGFSQEDLEAMPLVEKNKIIDAIEGQLALFKGDRNFLMR